MTGHGDVQELVDMLREAEAAGRVDAEVIHLLECRGRECISATYIKKAKTAAKDAQTDEEFLDNLAKSIRLLKREGDAVYMVYPKCYCHKLKGFEGVVPHSYCNCSAGWVKEMFEQGLGRSVEVEVEGSVLRGDDACRLRVHL